jgi:pilus assembly protein TadC
MLTEQEKLFIGYWEKNRDNHKRLFYQLLIGLPIGLVFAFPILLSVIFHDWYKQMIFISGSQVTVILAGVLGIAVFFALFRMKFKWEQNEQFYKELKYKEEKQ